jgi:hypothetical protein
MRVAAFGRELPSWFDDAALVENKWIRGAAFLVIFGFALFHLASLTFLPKLEDMASTQKM